MVLWIPNFHLILVTWDVLGMKYSEGGAFFGQSGEIQMCENHLGIKLLVRGYDRNIAMVGGSISLRFVNWKDYLVSGHRLMYRNSSVDKDYFYMRI